MNKTPHSTLITCLIKMVKIFIDGVACLGKTSFLKKIERQCGIPVKFTDYFEFQEQIRLPVELIDAGYNFWFNNETDESQPLLVDRSRYSNFIYSLIRQKFSVEEGKRCLCELKKISTDRRDLIIFIIPKVGQNSLVLDLMKKRQNGIDILEIEYVENQVNFFKIAADVLAMPIFEIDVLNFEESYIEILKLIIKKFDVQT